MNVKKAIIEIEINFYMLRVKLYLWLPYAQPGITFLYVKQEMCYQDTVFGTNYNNTYFTICQKTFKCVEINVGTCLIKQCP